MVRVMSLFKPTFLALTATVAVAIVAPRTVWATDIASAPSEVFGQWSLFCGAADTDASGKQCAVANGFKDDAGHWAKVAFEVRLGEPNIIVRTPGISQISRGVILAVDGRTVGRIFVDGCNADDSCDYSSRLDFAAVAALSAGRGLSIEYGLSKDSAVRLTSSLDGFKPAIAKLYEKSKLPIRSPFEQLDFFSGEFYLSVSLKQKPSKDGNWHNLTRIAGSCGKDSIEAVITGGTDFRIRQIDRVAMKRWVERKKAKSCFETNDVWVDYAGASKKGTNALVATTISDDTIPHAVSKVNLARDLHELGVPNDGLVVTDPSGAPLAVAVPGSP